MIDLITARQLAESITAALAAEGVEWQKSNADGFTLGDPEVEVRGIAVTFKPTMHVLADAAARGLNVIVSHEGTFWDGFDSPFLLNDDPVRQRKIEFARENGLVVWRLHDHMHRMHPEPIFTFLLRQLGWEEHFGGLGAMHHFEIPETSLAELAVHLQQRLETDNVSVVGDLEMRVRSVGFGAHGLSTVLPALHLSDVAIVGETAEFDTYEYVRDAVALGQPKGLIRIAHERLEEWGVAGFGEWLRTVAPGIRIEAIDTGDPFIVPNVAE
jgi:putative NIF3 family GTP cyclohydrolase 1 type 2